MAINRRLRSKVSLLGGLGVLTVAIVLLLLTRSSLFAGIAPVQTLVREAAGADVEMLVVWAASLLVGYAIWAGRSSTIRRLRSWSEADERDVEERFEATLETPPEVVTASRRAITNQKLDTKIEHAIQGDRVALRRVRSELARVASMAVAHRDGIDHSAAETAVDQGEWTDEHLPAAFLASDGAETFTVFERLRLWLDPAAERERRIRATVDTIGATYRWGQDQ